KSLHMRLPSGASTLCLKSFLTYSLVPRCILCSLLKNFSKEQTFSPLVDQKARNGFSICQVFGLQDEKSRVATGGSLAAFRGRSAISKSTGARPAQTPVIPVPRSRAGFGFLNFPEPRQTREMAQLRGAYAPVLRAVKLFLER